MWAIFLKAEQMFNELIVPILGWIYSLKFFHNV